MATIKVKLNKDLKFEFEGAGAEKFRDQFRFIENSGMFTASLLLPYDGVFGFGEKFDRLNQRGHKVLSSVIEKCFDQCEYTYCPIPFFFTRYGYGVFVDTLNPVMFDFTRIRDMSFSFEADVFGNLPDVYIFTGLPKEIISSFCALTSKTKIFPKWTFGTWMSSNRWHTQAEIEEQLDYLEKTKLPMNVMVLEAWSDETTYYIFNGAKYKVKKGNESFKYEDFDFSENEYWQDPKEMINKIHAQNVKLLLWEIPTYAAAEHCKKNRDMTQHDIDCDYAQKNKLCVMAKDGKPYKIPFGNWYSGSAIPDFTNPETQKIWFEKRKYLLDLGIDGYKTDGGEFIYSDDALFYNKATGKEMKNGYCQSYLASYNKFVGNSRILYSRAGYIGQQGVSTHWAGDQESKWSEFRGCIKAMISASISGITVCGYDLAGFAGELPSKDLYLRATQAAVFAPIMQWHSEPVGNGAWTTPREGVTNDRSPWNMAAFYKDAHLIERLRYHYNLRSNLIPYLYNLLLKANETGEPIIKSMILEYPEDDKCLEQEEQYVFGDMIVAPIVHEYQSKKDVYLPKGSWIDFYSLEKIEGGKSIVIDLHPDSTPVFIKENSCIVLNTDQTGFPGSYVGNALDKYNTLTFLLNGKGEYDFKDDLGNHIIIAWDETGYNEKKNILKTKIKVRKLD